MSKIDYNELVEFVRTHDEYYVAEFMFADNKRIAELEKDLEFTTKTANELIEIKHKLEQELDEKDKEIKKLNWQLKDKDFTIKNLNHSLSVAPNANAGQRARIDELTKIVKEKDKEIEELKQNNKTFMQLVEETKSKNIDDFVFLIRVINGSYIQKLRKANRRVQELEQSQTQLAIQELEKLKKQIDNLYIYSFKGESKIGDELISSGELISAIDNQIKELKGD